MKKQGAIQVLKFWCFFSTMIGVVAIVCHLGFGLFLLVSLICLLATKASYEIYTNGE